MKKLIKYLIGLMAGVFILSGLALIFLPMIVPLTEIANTFADDAEKQIGRSISIENVSFSIFSGIHLKEISVSNGKGFSPTPMLKIKDISFYYDLLPLILKQKVVVREAGINGIDLLVEMKGKETNLSLLSKPSEPKKKPEKETSEATKKTIPKDNNQPFAIDSSGLMDANISKLYVTNSNITVINHNNESKELKIQDLNVILTNINTNLKANPANIKSSLLVLGGDSKTTITFDGKILDFTEYDLRLKIDSIAADKLLEAFIKADDPKEKKEEKKKKVEKSKPGDPNFDFFKNFKIDFTFNLGEFWFKTFKVTDINAKASLKDLLFAFETKAHLYDGNVKLDLDTDLRQPSPAYQSVVKIDTVESKTFLKDAFEIENFVSGALSAEAELKSTLKVPANVNGVTKVLITNGTFISGKILGETAGGLLTGFEGKAFKKLSIGIKLKEGSPDIDSFDIGGEGYNFSLGATKKAVAKAKKEFETNLKTAKEEAVKQTQKAQKEVEAKLKKEMDRLKKDAEEKLKKQLKGLGI